MNSGLPNDAQFQYGEPACGNEPEVTNSPGYEGSHEPWMAEKIFQWEPTVITSPFPSIQLKWFGLSFLRAGGPPHRTAGLYDRYLDNGKKTRSPALSPAALLILISRCAKDMVGGIPVPCPKCGSKHFLCYHSKEKAGITIFYCMASGCGHEWVFGDMNPESGTGMTEPELSRNVPGHG